MTQETLFEVEPAPFLCREAAALGVSRRELMSDRYRCDIRGTRVLADSPDSMVLHIRTARLVLPEGGVFTGTTAAWLHGVFNPPPGSEVQVHLARGPDSRLRRTGCVGIRRHLRAEDVTDFYRLPVVTPLRLAFEQARAEYHLQEAVARVDAFVNAKLFSPKRFRRYVQRFRGYRGAKTARWAGELTRAGAESHGESRMRVQIVPAGLPEPELQISTRDDSGFEFARLDAGYRNASGRVVLGLEYDGKVHTHPTQSAHDKPETRGCWLSTTSNACGSAARTLSATRSPSPPPLRYLCAASSTAPADIRTSPTTPGLSDDEMERNPDDVASVRAAT